ncbi:CDP-alcohol phosphatidyltransferase family protein [Henriciella sp. AS95]|uniref:CDP-alcohol phosphatidyltransferase family protein n=1 Tax=Henriciella sp. AS95 TaxID=3135782 RepID=UPI00316B5678
MISNTVTIFRLLLTLPFFALLALNGPGWLALGLFLACGLLDIVDGKLARHLGETSRLGAMLDLLGDRMLTLAAVMGLILAGTLSLPASMAALVLIARCQTVSTFGEALGGPDRLTPSTFEHAKIALAFGGLGLMMAPAFWAQQAVLGEGLIYAAATLTLVTLAGYAIQAVKVLAPRPAN